MHVSCQTAFYGDNCTKVRSIQQNLTDLDTDRQGRMDHLHPRMARVHPILNNILDALRTLSGQVGRAVLFLSTIKTLFNFFT